MAAGFNIAWSASFRTASRLVERFEITRGLARWCKQQGFMYVIAIHKPDGHNDQRNYHVHCDFYDRPCRWLKRFGKWDFEVVHKAKNGDLRRPFCRNKSATFARDPDGKLNRKQHGEQMLKQVRTVVVESLTRFLPARACRPATTWVPTAIWA